MYIIKRTIWLFLCSSLAICSHLHATSLSLEQTIKQHSAELLPQTLKELEQSVNINSGSMNFAGVKAVGALADQQLSALGFTTQWLDGSDFNRAGHLLATKLSDDPLAPKIVMIGHLDTVFSQDDEFQTYQRIDEQTAKGPGVADMKGGNAIIINSMRILKRLGQLEKLSIKVLLTGDEESSGEPLQLSKKAIVDAAIWADIALGFENGDNNIGTAMAARRGYTGWTLKVTALPAHSSQIFTPEVGSGAIFEAARILHSMREALANQENLSFNPGLILGGTRVSEQNERSSGQAFGKSNVIAKEVIVKGDLRSFSQQQLISAKQEMTKIVAQNLPHSQASIEFETGYPPMTLSKGNLALLARYHQASVDLGYGPVVAANPRKAGAADISFAANHVEMALDGLGLMGRGAHTKDEVADLTTLQKNIEKTTLLLVRLIKPHS